MADVKFIRPGVTRFFMVAGTTHPTTAAAVAAGTELTSSIADVTGLTYVNAPAEERTYGDAFVGKVSGWDTAADTALKIHEKRVTNTLRTTLAKGTTFVLVVLPYGTAGAAPAAADVADTWLVQSAGIPREMSMTEVAAWHCNLTCQSRPHEDVVLS